MTEPASALEETQAAESVSPAGEEPPPTEPPPTPDPVPEPEVIEWEPQTWYSVTAACVTPGCPQENIVVFFPMFYSNNGDPAYIRVGCDADGCCGNACTILTATKLDPQPVEE